MVDRVPNARDESRWRGLVPGTPPFLLIGEPDVRSEIAKVYELGYRGRAWSRISFSLTVFHADYDHLRTQEFRLNPTVVFFANGMEGKEDGVETWGTVDVMRGWRLSAGYSKLHRSLELKPGSVDTAALATVGSDPAQRWTLRSSHDLPGQVEFDAIVRHASALANPRVPGYVAVDVRLGWSPRSDLELSVAGQNLFDPGHGEFANAATRSELGRTVFFRVLGRF